MSNYDGIDRLSPGDEDLLRADARDQAERLAAKCWLCNQPDDTQTGTCVRCEVVTARGREWDEGAGAA